MQPQKQLFVWLNLSSLSATVFVSFLYSSVSLLSLFLSDCVCVCVCVLTLRLVCSLDHGLQGSDSLQDSRQLLLTLRATPLHCLRNTHVIQINNQSSDQYVDAQRLFSRKIFRSHQDYIFISLISFQLREKDQLSLRQNYNDDLTNTERCLTTITAFSKIPRVRYVIFRCSGPVISSWGVKDTLKAFWGIFRTHVFKHQLFRFFIPRML